MGSTYVISDVHGHLDALRDVLLGAGLLDSDERWSGGDADLWVLGDLVDRGPDGIGVIRLVRSLQEQAPDSVRVLLGNHEALMLGCHLFPDTRFAQLWVINGGRLEDQQGLTEDDVAWLRGLRVMARVGGYLLMHSDTQDYLAWGDSVEAVNAAVAAVLAGNDAQQHFDVFAGLTSRFAFKDDPDTASTMLKRLGGEHIVHGHSIIGTLVDQPSEWTEGPLTYADGRVLAIDGGKYDGGPLLLVELNRGVTGHETGRTSPDS